MEIKRLFCVSALVVVYIASSNVDAAVFTQLGDWNRTVFTGGVGTENIRQASATGGVSYTNTYDGLPVSVGSVFKSIGAVPIQTLQQSTVGGGGSVNPTGNADVSAILNFALEGEVIDIQPDGTLSIRFNTGGAAIFEGDAAFGTPVFDTNDPNTWGSLDGLGAFQTPILTASVASPDSIDQGNLDARFINEDPSSVNVLSGTLSTGRIFSGLVLTLEFSDPGSLLTPTTFDPFGSPAGLIQAIVFDAITETINSPTGQLAIGAAEVTDLNTIFAGIFSALGLIPDAGFDFATGFDGTATPALATDYAPNQDLAAGGDFPTNLDATITVPAIQGVIPEPTSVLVWAMILGLAARFGYRRMR